MVIENDYVTIEEVHHHSRKLVQLRQRLTSSQMFAFQVNYCFSILLLYNVLDCVMIEHLLIC